ncbi:Hypothetical protein ORPV_183 [Orpheovirus IHUMI-LCC2]|uniref:Uncharacterized protein n=1 Tax=Orpheovirus IHUMI-LCC2 TaxID=2023057 RepID=A0A2I2L3J5_9VIRU|nr:Hypothetical protein ORPV_183 [Orpheovirus IHUMI-LCC2]SNW62087.1 Hypothetical protein ORPV_183 [Orpheovirus IHUMI-LCC2]
MSNNWEACSNIINEFTTVCKSIQDIYINDDKKSSLKYLEDISSLYVYITSMNEIVNNSTSDDNLAIKKLVLNLRHIKENEIRYIKIFTYKLVKDTKLGIKGKSLLSKLITIAVL